MSPHFSERSLVDLQVNGLTVPQGPERPRVVDFSSAKLTLEDIRLAVERLVEKGVRHFLPTIVTSPVEVTHRNLELLAHAMEKEPWGKHMLGIHLEGPFFTKACRGAHPEPYIIDRPDLGLFCDFQDSADGKIVLATVSPAIPEAPSFINALVKMGVVVSLGHHNATTSELEDAFQAGARGVTHAGNGWSKEIGKEPRKSSDVLAQLAADGVYVMLIPDGEHVPAQFIKYVHKIVEGLRPGHVVLVSDCSPLAGAPEGKYIVYDRLDVNIVRGTSGELKGEPLSGSYKLLPECLNILRTMDVMPEKHIIEGASTNALEFIRPALERTKRFPDLTTL